jgi:CDP-glucose 4,6-dehydratase
MKNLSIFKNKTVLVTGHTGFKGSWLTIWLSTLGAKVIGISNDIPSTPSNFIVSKVSTLHTDHRVDIRNANEVAEIFEEAQPDFVFHLAAQALVRTSYENPIETMSVNSLGTAVVLEALKKVDKKVVAIMITSDKAYDNVEWVWGYREDDRLGGKDPYSASKGMAELVIKSYFESFFSSNQENVKIGIARAGNVIGGGDWAVDRIVPDCMRAWSEAKVVDIRSPSATRPWQHVLEPLSGYLTLASYLHNNSDLHGQAYNFGPLSQNNQSVAQLIEEMALYWKDVKWNDTSGGDNNLHEAGLLKLNCDKALLDMKWLPTLDFSETIKMTTEWYREYYESSEKNMLHKTLEQIDQYSSIAKDKGMIWTKN